MANKFLPFVVEKSTPIHIYATLLSRSKGMKFELIASVFNLVLKVGIGPIREYVKTLEDMSVEALYENLTVQFEDCRIEGEDLEFYLSFARYIEADRVNRTSEELYDLDSKDLLVFLLVMRGHPDWATYTSYPFPLLEETMDKILNNLPNYISFSDTGTPRTFYSYSDLRAFILHETVLSNEKHADPTRAVFAANPNA